MYVEIALQNKQELYSSFLSVFLEGMNISNNINDTLNFLLTAKFMKAVQNLQIPS